MRHIRYAPRWRPDLDRVATTLPGVMREAITAGLDTHEVGVAAPAGPRVPRGGGGPPAPGVPPGGGPPARRPDWPLPSVVGSMPMSKVAETPLLSLVASSSSRSL